MKKIRFKVAFHGHLPGHVIGTRDSHAEALVAQGIAEFVADAVRPLKYAAGAALQTECVAPTIEEVEMAPKGVVLPDEIYEAPEDELQTPERATFKKKKANI